MKTQAARLFKIPKKSYGRGIIKKSDRKLKLLQY